MVENTTIEVRQQNLDATDSMAQYESPNSDDVCASYISRKVASDLGEFASLNISDDASVEADLQKETTNYAVYETPNGLVTGLYISREVFGEDSPDSIGLTLSESSEEAFEEAQAERNEEEEEAAEEEADALLGGSESDDSDEEEVEIADEELDEELGLTEEA